MSFTSRRRLILPALVTIAFASLLRPYITSRALAQTRRTGGSTSTRNVASTSVRSP
jgi:hypothetical protein